MYRLLTIPGAADGAAGVGVRRLRLPAPPVRALLALFAVVGVGALWLRRRNRWPPKTQDGKREGHVLPYATPDVWGTPATLSLAAASIDTAALTGPSLTGPSLTERSDRSSIRERPPSDRRILSDRRYGLPGAPTPDGSARGGAGGQAPSQSV